MTGIERIVSWPCYEKSIMTLLCSTTLGILDNLLNKGMLTQTNTMPMHTPASDSTARHQRRKRQYGLSRPTRRRRAKGRPRRRRWYGTARPGKHYLTQHNCRCITCIAWWNICINNDTCTHSSYTLDSHKYATQTHTHTCMCICIHMCVYIIHLYYLYIITARTARP